MASVRGVIDAVSGTSCHSRRTSRRGPASPRDSTARRRDRYGTARRVHPVELPEHAQLPVRMDAGGPVRVRHHRVERRREGIGGVEEQQVGDRGVIGRLPGRCQAVASPCHVALARGHGLERQHERSAGRGGGQRARPRGEARVSDDGRDPLVGAQRESRSDGAVGEERVVGEVVRRDHDTGVAPPEQRRLVVEGLERGGVRGRIVLPCIWYVEAPVFGLRVPGIVERARPRCEMEGGRGVVSRYVRL